MAGKDGNRLFWKARAALTAAGAGIVGAWPVAALCVTFFRFPIPFYGPVSGPDQILTAMWAVMIYGVYLGGLLLIAALAIVLALVGAALLKPGVERDDVTDVSLGVMAGVAADVIVIGLLVNWDHIYGPW